MIDRKFLERQFQHLRGLLRLNARTSLHAQLEIHHLPGHFTNDALYAEFCERVPVLSLPEYHAFLARMTGEDILHTPAILARKNMVSVAGVSALAQNASGLFPLSKSILKAFVDLDADILSGRVQGLGKPVKGKFFHVFENVDLHKQDGVEVGHIRLLLAKHRSFWTSRRFLPSYSDISHSGKSRYQRLHTFVDALEKAGPEVEILMARPRFLTNMALLLAQREGRPVSLKELCPNLRVYVHYGETMAAYRKELTQFFEGLPNLRLLEVYTSPAGVIAVQDDLNIWRRLRLDDSAQVFYEFIPEEDIDAAGHLKRGYRRLHAGQVERGKRYAVVASNDAGVLAVNTGDIVEIRSLVPLTLSYRRKAERLNLFGEMLATDDMEDVIAAVNDDYFASHGLYLREYMAADDSGMRKMRWVFELNKSPQELSRIALQGLANRIHMDLALKNPAYFRVTKDGVGVPDISFVPVGTFAYMPESFTPMHLDLSEDARSVRDVLRRAGHVVTLAPVSV